MKKFLSVLIVVVIFFFGIIGVLAGIPHVHGSDSNHSHHKSCPLYQFNLLNPNGSNAVFEIAVFLLFIFSVLNYGRNNFLSLDQFSIKYFSSRAPPVIL